MSKVFFKYDIDNTKVYTPTQSYHPATLDYVSSALSAVTKAIKIN